MGKHKIYTFYAKLNDYEPAIWREFEINGERSIAELSYAIMIMFEMQGRHLFRLKELKREATKNLLENLGDNVTEQELMDINNNLYEFPYDDDIFIEKDETLIIPNTESIQSTGTFVGTNFLFDYDYGDGWQVSLTLKSIRKEEISLRLLPRVLKGEGYGIVEDVGGVYGLAKTAAILKEKKGSEFEKLAYWLDSTTLDLESFDVEDINFRLKRVMRIYKDLYEESLEPTTASAKLLMRDYLNKGSFGY